MFTDSYATAFSSFNQGLSDMILHAKSWGDVWGSIQLSVATSFVNGGVKMFTDWLAQFSLMKLREWGITELFEGKKTVSAVAGALARGGAAATEETAKTTAAAAGASARIPIVTGEAATVGLMAGIAGVFRSIMELGPIAGPVVMISAVAGMIAMVKSIAGGGFSSGGYTGDGGKYEYAGPAHKGEVIFNQEAVQAIGKDRLESIRINRALPYSVGVSDGGAAPFGSNAGTSRPMSIVLVDTDREARRIAKNSDTDAHIVSVMRRNKYQIAAN